MTKSPVHPALAEQIATDPETAVAVVVEFSRAQDPDELAGLGLAALGSTMAGGHLTPAEVATLAERPDVRRIEGVPDVDPT